jgi:6-pyruvoyltetrahydropterin/6-carboxytetrahydropterin synthase
VSNDAAPAPPLIRITSSSHFSAAHRLQNDSKEADWNRLVFDKCNNPFGHGHTYVLDVTVEGPLQEETGWVMDFKDLKRVVDERIIQRCNCRNLNVDVPFLHGVNPTAEILAVKFWEELEPGLAPIRLVRVVLHETPRNKVVYTGSRSRSE